MRNGKKSHLKKCFYYFAERRVLKAAMNVLAAMKKTLAKLKLLAIQVMDKNIYMKKIAYRVLLSGEFSINNNL